MTITLKEKPAPKERTTVHNLTHAPLVPVGNGVYECDLTRSGTLTEAETAAIRAASFRVKTAEKVKAMRGQSLRKIARETRLSYWTVARIHSILKKTSALVNVNNSKLVKLQKQDLNI